MTYLIIALIIAVALAPLLHFVPSKQQRAQARLRETAALAGRFVEFRELPGLETRAGRVSAGERQVLYYGKRLAPSKGRAKRRGVWRRKGGDWAPVGGRENPPSILNELPRQILASSIDEASCGVYWREEGGVEMVEQIAHSLETWAQQN